MVFSSGKENAEKVLPLSEKVTFGSGCWCPPAIHSLYALFEIAVYPVFITIKPLKHCLAGLRFLFFFLHFWKVKPLLCNGHYHCIP